MKHNDDKKIFIKDNDYVTVTRMNHITEIQYLQKVNSESNIRKLDKDSYVDLSTGEIKEFKKNDNRALNINSLMKTMKKLRYLINNNFIGSNNELFITLTYKENMRDLKVLYKDFSLFMKRLRYKYKDVDIEYINVIEPQQRGAWHCHVLLKATNKNTFYIPNEELRKLWKHGFVRVNRLQNVDNIGAYVTSYLTDIIVDDDAVGTDIKEKEIKTKDGYESKKVKKNGRLYLYPSGANFFRKSKGIIYPERKRYKYKEIKKSQLGTLTFEKDVFIEKDDFENKIRYEYYNLKRD